MFRLTLGLAAMALAGALAAGSMTPAAAQDRDHDGDRSTRAFAAQRSPRITIHPRHGQLSPTATRHCRAWLAQEYRPSGTVITPQMRCWWED